MNDPSTAELIAKHPFCIFCGGGKASTTAEHCPPRAAFDGRQAPEGFMFAACEACNAGSSDEDLVASFLAHIDPSVDGASTQAIGLLRAVARQTPGVMAAGRYPATEARQKARALGIRPKPGELYQDLPFVRVVPEMDRAVESLAKKLTKAMYYQQTGKIFPADGGILFHWFTNEALYRTGKVPALEALVELHAVAPPLVRNGKNLSDQFGILVTVPEGGAQILVQTLFGKSFGFITYGLSGAGEAERVQALLKRETKSGKAHFEVL